MLYKIGNSWLELDETPDEIVPGLFLSSVYVASKLSEANPWGIEAVLNVATNSWEGKIESLTYPKHPDIQYEEIPFHDGSQVSEEDFHAALHFLRNTHGKGLKTLVHCAAGISRSATIVCAYIVGTWQDKQYIQDLDEAIAFVRERRSKINPHVELRVSAKKHLGLWPYGEGWDQ